MRDFGAGLRQLLCGARGAMPLRRDEQHPTADREQKIETDESGGGLPTAEGERGHAPDPGVVVVDGVPVPVVVKPVVAPFNCAEIAKVTTPVFRSVTLEVS